MRAVFRTKTFSPLDDRRTDACVSFCFFCLVRSFFSAGAEFFGVVSSAVRSEDLSVYYQLCTGCMGRPWRELWPPKAAKTGSISRGTNFEKSGRGVGTCIFVCGAFLSSTLTRSRYCAVRRTQQHAALLLYMLTRHAVHRLRSP